jgi:D-3-phosphoglycerate dehydrogenase / 2-oxoglutarate reductase
MAKKILITTSSFGKSEPAALDPLVKQGLEVILNPLGRKLTENEVSELIQANQPLGLIAGVEPLTRQVLEKAVNLKIISRCGIGMDSVDLQAAQELGIVVTNTPNGPTLAVAELTMGLILALLRRIHVSDASIRRAGWDRPMGGLLHGKTVGIIGCGRIGGHVAKLLSSFGCLTLGCDLECQDSSYFTTENLEKILPLADILTLHVPYSAMNHHFINAARFKLMKPGAIIVNASRGGLIDEEALSDALKNGHLSGAALDCFEKEPYNGPLKELDNVLLTAHIGSYAKEARIMMEQQAVENLLHNLAL